MIKQTLERISLKILVLIFLVSLAFCNKPEPEPKPDIFGEWETISVIGDKWDYRITEDGWFCQTIPEVYTSWFCFPFSHGDYAVLVNKGNDRLEYWKFEFSCYDVAEVTVTVDSVVVQTLVLKRK